MKPPRAPKILIIRFSSLGDVVLTTAILPNLKAHWPEGTVTFLTKKSFSPVLSGNPSVDRVWAFDPEKESFSELAKKVRKEGFEIVIDLHQNLRSWVLRAFAGAPFTVWVEKSAWARRKLLLFKKPSPALRRSVREKILDCLSPLGVPISHTETQMFPPNPLGVLEKFSLDPKRILIALAPGAKRETKRWKAEGFAEAANRLGAIKNVELFILGAPDDAHACKSVAEKIKMPVANLCGQTSILEMASLLSQTKLLLTNDSGVMHVAESVGTPLVAMFGPTTRALGFGPYRATSRVVEVGNLNCRPCTLHGDETCPLGHHKCMRELDENAVLVACSSIMKDQETFMGPVTEGSL